MHSPIKYVFTPNDAKYQGVRPLNIYLLRMFYFLIALFVATDSWQTILKHEGPWDRFQAMSVCVWAAYATLGVLGILHPLKMLPLMVFMIFYKSLWLAVVALPALASRNFGGIAVGGNGRCFCFRTNRGDLSSLDLFLQKLRPSVEKNSG